MGFGKERGNIKMDRRESYVTLRASGYYTLCSFYKEGGPTAFNGQSWDLSAGIQKPGAALARDGCRVSPYTKRL